MKDNKNINFKKFNKKTIGLQDSVEPQGNVIQIDNSNTNKLLNSDLLFTCRTYYESLSQFRAQAKRARNYDQGKQWSETVRDPKSGKMMTEEEYIISQGKIPFKNNQIRQIVKNVVGQQRNNPTKSIVLSRTGQYGLEKEMMTNALDYVHQLNVTREVDAHCYHKFLLSGAIIQKLTCRFDKGRSRNEIYIDTPNLTKMFFNTDIKDIRINDLNLIGELIDSPIEAVITAFAKNKEDEQKIRQIYSNVSHDKLISAYGLTSNDIDRTDFMMPTDTTKCRVIEIWQQKSEWRLMVHDSLNPSELIITRQTKSQIDALNNERIKEAVSQGVDKNDVPLYEYEEHFYQYWCYKFLSPFGDILAEGESMYEHEEHPYVLTLYPLIDGNVWGFVTDIIDQQRQMNRLIILQDMIINASAKGVLMIPEDTLGNYTPEEFADEWTKFNGVIIYKPSTKHNHVPQQISANSVNVGIPEMIAQQMNMLKEISGVDGAIQGQAPTSGTPAELYAQQAQNSSTNLADYVHTLIAFKQKRDYKVLKLIKQYFTEPMYLSVSGRDYSETAKMFIPEKIADIEFDTVIANSADTPIHRQMQDNLLMQLLNTQQISIELFLENTTMPFAEKLLESIKREKDKIQQGQQQQQPQAQGMPPVTTPMQPPAALGQQQAIHQQLQHGQNDGQPPVNSQSMGILKKAIGR